VCKGYLYFISKETCVKAPACKSIPQQHRSVKASVFRSTCTSVCKCFCVKAPWCKTPVREGVCVKPSLGKRMCMCKCLCKNMSLWKHLCVKASVYNPKPRSICSILHLAPAHCLVWCNISSLHGALPSDSILQQCEADICNCRVFARFRTISENRVVVSRRSEAKKMYTVERLHI
jgi:hypothetical protein